jgi:hypothetical protein
MIICVGPTIMIFSQPFSITLLRKGTRKDFGRSAKMESETSV